MDWLDLYNILHQKANDVHNLDSELWRDEVLVHDSATGKEYFAEVIEVDTEGVEYG